MFALPPEIVKASPPPPAPGLDPIARSVLRAQLARKRYVLVRGLVPEAQRRSVYEYIVRAAEAGSMLDGDHLVPNTPTAYADPETEKVLEDLCPTVSALFERDLVPTNSYLRLYKRGDKLDRHTDRPGCECSVTACFGYEDDQPWAFHVEGPEGAAAVIMRPGDGVLYYGSECPHWREPYEGQRLAQVFFHYVDRAGENAEWAYDKRPGTA